MVGRVKVVVAGGSGVVLAGSPRPVRDTELMAHLRAVGRHDEPRPAVADLLRSCPDPAR